jgi:chemotaxis protein histidine kinase CheA
LQLLDGNYEVKSEIGKGTVVTILIPHAMAKAPKSFSQSEAE